MRTLLVVILVCAGIFAVGFPAFYFSTTSPAPDFLGSTLSGAGKKAESADFELYVEYVTASRTKPIGTVVGQTPVPNKRVTDRKVGLILSGGRGTVEVPDASGTSRVEGCKELMQAGLNPEPCSTWNVDRNGNLVTGTNGPGPTVTATDPPAEAEVQVGTEVTMYR